jgi:glucose 1-dehydrogenase
VSTVEQNLKDQTAIISGGLGDIGRAIAMELARRGANVALGDVRPPEDAAPLLKLLREIGVRCRYDRADVSDAKQVKAWVESAEKDLGVAALIIPNAAIVATSKIGDLKPESWAAQINVNLTGAFYLAQVGAVRLLEHNKPGRIVFTGSWAAHAAHPQIPAYCASKAGLRMLCKCMALELAPHGILVNEVAPGYVDAGLTGQFFARHPENRPAAAARVPTGQLISAEDVAKGIAFLCDPENRHMTGTVLLLDGGLSLVTPAKK